MIKVDKQNKGIRNWLNGWQWIWDRIRQQIWDLIRQQIRDPIQNPIWEQALHLIWHEIQDSIPQIEAVYLRPGPWVGSRSDPTAFLLTSPWNIQGGLSENEKACNCPKKVNGIHFENLNIFWHVLLPTRTGARSSLVCSVKQIITLSLPALHNLSTNIYFSFLVFPLQQLFLVVIVK